MPLAQGATSNEYRADARSKVANPSGLALIERIYFGSGLRMAREQLQHLLGPDQSLRPYALCDNGNPSSGIDFVAAADVSSQSYNPPVSWNAAYSLQLLRFNSKGKERDEFAFHSGEEILIPIEGALSYRFFWSPGGRPPETMMIGEPAKDGCILRINPQIPHRASCVQGEARAWLVLRHATNSPVALVTDQSSGALVLRSSETSDVFLSSAGTATNLRSPNRRHWTSKDLKKAGAYAMVAWGISEAVRDARQKTGRTITDLANQIGIDPSSLSRLEEAKANVSIEMLAKVCRGLRIGMSDCIDSGSWTHEMRHIDAQQSGRMDSALPRPPRGTHSLHPYVLHLTKGQAITATAVRGNDPEQISSWIVVKGRVLLEFPNAWGRKSAIIDPGNVIHFREQGVLGVHPLQDSLIVQVAHSHACECRSRETTEEAPPAVKGAVGVDGSRPSIPVRPTS